MPETNNDVCHAGRKVPVGRYKQNSGAAVKCTLLPINVDSSCALSINTRRNVPKGAYVRCFSRITWCIVVKPVSHAKNMARMLSKISCEGPQSTRRILFHQGNDSNARRKNNRFQSQAHDRDEGSFWTQRYSRPRGCRREGLIGRSLRNGKLADIVDRGNQR